MNVYDDRIARERERVRQVSGFVATALGDGWKVDTSDRYAEHTGVYIDGPDNLRIWLRIGSRDRNGRLVISGVYPDEARGMYGLKRSEITTAVDKDPGAIARDITRRLLPEFTPDLAKAIERVNAERIAADNRAATTARLIALPGVENVRNGDTLWVRIGTVYGDCKVMHDGDSVEITVRDVPIDLAEEFFKALAADWRKDSNA